MRRSKFTRARHTACSPRIKIRSTRTYWHSFNPETVHWNNTMQTPTENKTPTSDPSSRLHKLGIVLPAPPMPLGAYVESSDTGDLLFLSGMLPVVNRKLAISGRLGENLSVKEGQEAARIASLNVLAAAEEHLGTLNRLKKLVKLTVLIATTEQFA